MVVVTEDKIFWEAVEFGDMVGGRINVGEGIILRVRLMW